MKITIICHDIPYPINNGGRADAWRRIKAFSEFGAEIQLITWYKELPSQETSKEIDRYVNSKYFLPFPRSLSSKIHRLIDLTQYPLEVTSRIVRGKNLLGLFSAVERFNPQVIWLDHLHGAEIAHCLAEKYNLPIVSRSHNIEHLYYKRLQTSARGFVSNLKRTLSVRNLHQYELQNLDKSTIFYDISLDDLKFWQERGFTNGRYLPPLIDFASFNRGLKQAKHKAQPKYDLVFLGNLYSDNNVAGVVWFINQVLPQVREILPETSVLIAGSNPTKEIQELCHQTHNIELKINPPSTSPIYRSAKVLINPTPTGSGVNMKSLEMLLAQRPIVSQPQGIAGLSRELKSYFSIANNAEDFATEIIDLLLGKKQIPVADRSLLESLFGFRAIDRVLQEIRAIVQVPNQKKPVVQTNK